MGKLNIGMIAVQIRTKPSHSLCLIHPKFRFAISRLCVGIVPVPLRSQLCSIDLEDLLKFRQRGTIINSRRHFPAAEGNRIENKAQRPSLLVNENKHRGDYKIIFVKYDERRSEMKRNAKLCTKLTFKSGGVYRVPTSTQLFKLGFYNIIFR